MTSTDPFTGLGFDPSTKFDASYAADRLGVMINHWVQSSTTDAFTQGVHTDSPPAADATAATTTTAPDSGGTNDAIGIPKDTRVSGAFGEMRGGGPHPGIDLAVPVGTPLVAAMDGKITVAGNNDPNGYGNYVEITTANGMTIRYGHLSAIGVSVGDTVKAGQLIGKSGGEAGAPGSGNSEGPHVHFEVDVNGTPVDPNAVLAGGGQIVKGTATSNPAVQHAASTASYTSSTTGSDPFLAGVHTPTSTTPTQSATAGSTVSGATSGSDSDPAAVDAFLNATKQHESGGDYTIYNQSGQSNASGAYQFLNSTWKGAGGSTEAAAQASPAEQDAVARRMALALFDQFHSWRLVAIAWYGGPGVAQQVASGQDPGSPEGQGGYLAYGDTIASMMGGR